MKKIEQGFIIDRLTDSIVNTISGDRFQTEMATLKKSDFKSVLKRMVGILIGKQNTMISRRKLISLLL